MRRRSAVTLALVVGGPVLFAGGSSVLLRHQSARLRHSFGALADDLDPPGLRTVARPSRHTLALQAAEALTPAEAAASSSAPTESSLAAAEAPSRSQPASPQAAPPPPTAALVVLGDAWLAGSAPADPAHLMSRGLASLLGMPVALTALADASARAESLPAQVDRALADPHLRAHGGPRVAVLSMGTADILFPVTGSITLGVLSSALSRLQRAGFATVLLCCPNLGSLPGVRNPLRTVLRRSSRVLSGSQWLAALAAGAMPLSLTAILSGTAHADLVDASGLRPSALGRRQLAAAVLHAIADRLELPRTSTPREDE